MIDLISLLGGSFVFIKLLESFNIKLSSIYNAVILTTTFVLLLWSSYQISLNDPFVKRIWNTVSYIPMNIWLWIFGNVKEHRILNDIHKTTLALQESSLFGQLAELRSRDIECYHILFTHKDGHERDIGDEEHYRIPGFPFDEAELIMRLFYFVASNLNLGWSDIRIRCSCCYDNQQIRDKIAKGAMAIIGSPKANRFSSHLMERIKELEKKKRLEREHTYTMEVEGELCYLKGHKPSDEDLRPDDTNPTSPDTKKEMTDYAMMMKLPNLLSDNKIDRRKTIILFAGCKVAGQFALTEWISKPANLVNLVSNFSSKYFYSIFEVKYRFVPQGVPNLISIKQCQDNQGQSIQGEIRII